MSAIEAARDHDPSGWVALGTIIAMIVFTWIFGAPKGGGGGSDS